MQQRTMPASAVSRGGRTCAIEIRSPRGWLSSCLVPRPHKKLVTCHDVFTPAAGYRDRVVSGTFTAMQKKLLESAAHGCPVHKSLHPDVDAPITIRWGA